MITMNPSGYRRGYIRKCKAGIDMDYFCDIYDKIIGTSGIVVIFGLFITFFCPVMPTTAGTKKALCLGIFLVLTAGVVFLLLPSKTFVCGA